MHTQIDANILSVKYTTCSCRMEEIIDVLRELTAA